MGSIITNDAKCTCEIKSGFAITQATLGEKKIPFTKKTGFNLRKKLVKSYIESMAL